MKKQLQIRIYPDGKVDAKTLGIKGERCTKYIQTLEQLLQSRTVESAYTEEYDQSEVVEVSETIIQQTNS